MPFHAAEQRNKLRKNDSAEYPAKRYDFPKRPHFVSSTGKFAPGEPSERLHFLCRIKHCWFVSLYPKEHKYKQRNEHKKRL